jgi:hypothetical protein
MEDAFISVGAASAAEENRLVRDLEATLRRLDSSPLVRRHKPESSTLDLGTTLVVVIGSPAAAGLVTGIIGWLTRHRGVDLTMRRGDAELSLKNVDYETAERQIARFFST